MGTFRGMGANPDRKEDRIKQNFCQPQMKN